MSIGASILKKFCWDLKFEEDPKTQTGRLVTISLQLA